MEIRMIQEYYSREDIQKAILGLAKNREVAGMFESGSFSKRPNILVYPKDITEMVKSGVIEFHSSLERWSNPMALRPDNHEKLRIGWDLILDIDCKEFEHSKVATRVMIDALKAHDVKGFSLKYTGGKGFHIGIPWESIPKEVNYKDAVKQFPDLARIVGDYLRDFTKETLKNELLKICGNDPIKLAEQAGVDIKDIAQKKSWSIVNPYVFAKSSNKISPKKTVIETDEIDISKIANIKPISDLDSVLISPRHLFRMPYSLNMKTGLVSVPIKLENLPRFKKDDAHPDLVRVREKFLDKGKPGETDILVAEAADWWTMRQVTEMEKIIRKAALKKPAPKELFPPCIKNIDMGLSDGRKRSIFILRSFLYSLRWDKKDVENFIIEWNKKNKPPLPDSIIRGQLRLRRSIKDSVPPPNCTKEGYYESFGVCKPDHICGKDKRIKNPVKYTIVNIEKKKKMRRNKRVRG